MAGNRLRVLADWSLNAVAKPEATSFRNADVKAIPLDPSQPTADAGRGLTRAED